MFLRVLPYVSKSAPEPVAGIRAFGSVRLRAPKSLEKKVRADQNQTYFS